MSDEQIVQSFAGLRIAVGAGAWLAPRLSGRLLGIESAQAGYLMRLFGVRDAALALGLLTSERSQRAAWLRMAIGCDLADAAASLLALRRGELETFPAAVVTGAGVGAAVLGGLLLRRETN